MARSWLAVLLCLKICFRVSGGVVITLEPQGPISLKTALQGIETGSTIVLKDGVYSGSQTCGVLVNSSLTIRGEGNNTVIDCLGESRAWTITGSDVAIDNLQFVNGDAKADQGGGGCLVLAGSGFALSNLRFKNCRADLRGGAISVSEVPGSIISTRFQGCQGSYGGAISFTGASSTTLQLQDISADSCVASNDGAVLSANGGHVSMSGQLQFTDNTAGGGGGVAAVENGILRIDAAGIASSSRTPHPLRDARLLTLQCSCRDPQAG
eukprot:49385-Rhodomonas_salina.1